MKMSAKRPLGLFQVTLLPYTRFSVLRSSKHPTTRRILLANKATHCAATKFDTMKRGSSVDRVERHRSCGRTSTHAAPFINCSFGSAQSGLLEVCSTRLQHGTIIIIVKTLAWRASTGNACLDDVYFPRSLTGACSCGGLPRLKQLKPELSMDIHLHAGHPHIGGS